MVEIWRDHGKPLASTEDYRADGKPYMPANGTEGMDFEERWCARCGYDDPDVGDFCEILGNAMLGNQPAEWIYRNRQGCCTKFTSLDGMQPKPEPRCELTMELSI